MPEAVMSRSALMVIVALAAAAGLIAATGLAADSQGSVAAPTVASRYTFSWPTGPGAPAPRGGTTRGVPVELDREPSREWQALQQAGSSAMERDRRAILAMAGSYRVNFDFLEVASFAGNGDRPRPYQSWGTEKVFVDRNEPRHVSLVHILDMRVVGDDGKPGESMVTKHWRQDWLYEPEFVVEYQGGNRWNKRALSAAERRGQWVQQVYQVDEAPRYGSLGRWEHNAAFSTWISGETARPLPRREWSVRKDYALLRGTNRHTVLPTGWMQEENNLKDAAGVRDAAGSIAAGAPAVPFVGREYGVARYERLKGADFAGADSYYAATREFWIAVMAEWRAYWQKSTQLDLTAHSDQSGGFADLFNLADEFAAGRLKPPQMGERIRATLGSSRD
jgi:hypothetical protein